MEDSNPKYHPLSFVDIVIFLHQFLFPPGVARLGSQPLNSPPPICGLGRLSCCDQCFALFTRSTYPPHRGKVLVRYRQPPPPMLTCQELGRTQPLNHGPFPGWGIRNVTEPLFSLCCTSTVNLQIFNKTLTQIRFLC